ncbi:putative PH-like domain superfamily, PH-BEACH domain-containing protein [Helianthus debilis subsp. tardiflorus]
MRAPVRLGGTIRIAVFSICICEKECENDLSVIDRVLSVTEDAPLSIDSQSKSPSSWGVDINKHSGAWDNESAINNRNVPHLWRMWKLNSVHELLKRDYQLHSVAIEIFSMDGCNDLLVFHKKEREEIFRNMLAMNLPRNNTNVFSQHLLSYKTYMI